MSNQSIPTNARHVGMCVCEFAHLVVPVASTYARRDNAEDACKAAVEDALGCEVTACHLWPVSQCEAVREAIDLASADQSGAWMVCDLIVVTPNAAREAEKAEREAELERAVSTADGLMAVLAADGIASAYSKGGNVWAQAPKSAGLERYGMTWSGKRAAWWCKVDAGEAVPVSMRKQRAAAKSARKAA